jgi:hypothetical protein
MCQRSGQQVDQRFWSRSRCLLESRRSSFGPGAGGENPDHPGKIGRPVPPQGHPGDFRLLGGRHGFGVLDGHLSRTEAASSAPVGGVSRHLLNEPASPSLSRYHIPLRVRSPHVGG